MNKKPNKMAKEYNEVLIDIIKAGLVGDSGKVELAALSLARSVKNENPDIAKSINQVISSFALTGGTIRNVGLTAPMPIDNDSQLEMATVTSPNKLLFQAPILSEATNARISSFLEERNNINVLLDRNIRPSISMLLIGQPGTGKTMLARYIASTLNKNLVVLDLSASISSLMGKTGANLKKVLQYAKQNACVLLFDEFDAIAKKRGDATDLGEVKRVVNVLLMELEDWPVSSIFIATSNHPELLDKAIWRRFDHVINLDVPEKQQRVELLQSELRDFLKEFEIKKNILTPISELLEGRSAADISKFANNVKRRVILRQENPLVSCLHELEVYNSDKKIRGKFCLLAKEMLGDSITVREIAEITGLSPAGVQHHISKAKAYE